MLRAPVMRGGEQKKLVRLQRQFTRCRKGSRRRAKVKARITKLHARVADRRKDWIEKTTTRIAATYGVVVVEKLGTRNMVRAPKPKPDPDNVGKYLPNGKAAKAGLNRNSVARTVAIATTRTSRQLAQSLLGKSSPRSSPGRRQHPHSWVCSRKREDLIPRKRHRESRDLQSREKVNSRLSPRCSDLSSPNKSNGPAVQVFLDGLLAERERRRRLASVADAYGSAGAATLGGWRDETREWESVDDDDNE